MTLLDALLDAIVRLDGDSLVMHVGEKPYVLTTSSAMSAVRGPLSWGQVELSSRPLTADAVLGMLGQILPLEQRLLLDDIGAIEHELESKVPGLPAFILTAARGGDDVWVEVRRKVEPVAPPAVEPVPEPVAAPAAGAPAAEAPPVEVPLVQVPAAEPEFLPVAEEEPVAEPAITEVVAPPAVEPEAVLAAEPVDEEVAAEPPTFEIVAEEPQEEVGHDDVHAVEMPEGVGWMAEEPEPVAEPEIVLHFDEPEQSVQFHAPEREAEAVAEEPAIEIVAEEPAIEIVAEEPAIEIVAEEPAIEIVAEEPAIEIVAEEPAIEIAAEEPAFEIVAEEPTFGIGAEEPAIQFVIEDEPAIELVLDEPEAVPVAAELAPVVVPIAKPTLKLQPQPVAPAASTEASLVGLLKAAAARGASTLYAVADSRPMVRVDGGVCVLGIEASVTAAEVDRFAFEFAPRDQVAEPTSEWACSVKGVGRVRCITFHDDSGTGLIVHLPSANVSTAEELGLSARIQALCGEADGLVVIAGPRGNGKSTLLDAFVDLINRTRNDHVITIESHIRTAHEKRHSFISQRQSAPDGEAIAAAARAALREGPDVLVIEDLRAPEALSVALDASRAGRLVFGGISAPTASVAVERLVGAFRGDRRPQVRALLAGSLRAVIAQTLVRKQTGGRVGARELLLNSPAVEKLILDGAFAQLPIAIDGGRGLGMVTMNDALGALVRDGVVDVNDACRCAPDRGSLIAALERDGIDVSNVERRA